MASNVSIFMLQPSGLNTIKVPIIDTGMVGAVIITV